jgi:N-glycosylase/DNA lyase
MVDKKLIDKIKELKKSPVSELIEKRKNQFLSLQKKSYKYWFEELCFCLLTANTSFELGFRIQKEFGYIGFTCHSSEEQLAKRLKDARYRFYNRRAHFIYLACMYKHDIKKIISSLRTEEKREWLIRNIKGLGYKESSHFLRNVGYFDYAILDFHIIDLLEKETYLKRPKTLTKIHYIEIEKKLKAYAKKLNLEPGILDLYLWYIETGSVDK